MKTIFYFAAEKLIDGDAFPQPAAGNEQLLGIINFIFGVSAAVAVLMIVVAGFFFVTARGNPETVSKARMTILWACIGLVVVVFAATIINFVVFRVTG